MGKNHHSSSAEPQDLSEAQQARGYRGMSVDIKHADIGDPRGEAAYQKAFADAAKLNPPRVPNASFYTNSPSAKDFVAKRDRQLLGQNGPVPASTKTKKNPAFAAPIPDMHRLARDASQGRAHSQSHSPGSATSHQVNDEYGNGVVRGAQDFGSPRGFPGQGPPLLMEPQFGPTGPAKMLR